MRSVVISFVVLWTLSKVFGIPVVTTFPQTFEVLINDSVHLPCEVQNKGPEDTIVWEFVDHNITISTGHDIRIKDNFGKYEITSNGTSVLLQWNLTIKNVQYEDHGTYKCSVRGKDERHSITVVHHVKVEGAPGRPTAPEFNVMPCCKKILDPCIYPVCDRRNANLASFVAALTNATCVVNNLIQVIECGPGVGDSVRCYHCGGGLRNWEAGDKPMLEHAKWYPKCAHVLLVKGQEYIDAAGRGEDMDVMQAANKIPTNEKLKPIYKPDIKCVAAQSCVEMGYSMKAVQRAMEIFCDVQGHGDFKARDLLEIIMDNEERELASEGASNVIDSRSETVEKESDSEDEETLQRMYEENKRIRESQTCKICLEDMAAIIFLPCGHLVACPQCAPALLKCPVCRLEVKGQVKARFN